MSNLGPIHTYRSEVDQIIRFGGSRNETTIRRAFSTLINTYARPRDLLLVEELDYYNPQKRKTVRPDGTLKNSLRLDYGFWESKDPDDELTEDIKRKFDRGYPDSNILFEDSSTAILYQDGSRLLTAPFAQTEALDELLTAYVSFEHPEVREFKVAVERFKHDIPNIVTTLRGMILKQGQLNGEFRQRRQTFLALCRSAINPAVTADDVDEMLIQHILTEEIFLSIFSDTQLMEENNIARELREVEKTFFTGQTKRDTLGQIKHYYECIKAHATSIVSPKEKQTFLKVIYENFYKAYNPKGADRLGIVYTPGEIVDFMVRSTDTLLHRHFGRGLADKNVEILDPATGTGTYICDLIEYLPREVLMRKYKNELHANEVAILPYYIANLNIETAFNAKMGTYAPFNNICFVDTLDNTEGLRVDNQWELGGVSEENTRRIKEQNKRKISVVIGNPPYNANQQNENDNNKNRPYPHIDRRIKATYIAASTAQKTKSYDMYLRFIRWASDRLEEQGIVSFICNRSFIDSRQADGFRKTIGGGWENEEGQTVPSEFSHVYVVDLGGDYLTPTAGKANVFGIGTGVAIVFLIKNGKQSGRAEINYVATPENATRDQKLELLSASKLEALDSTRIEPDDDGNWLNVDTSDFKSLIPLVGEPEKSVFALTSNGVVSNRDDWVYDVDQKTLAKKAKFISDEYNRLLAERDNSFPSTIKWSRDLKRKFEQGRKSKYERKLIVSALYRPFTKLSLYSEKLFVDILTDNHYQMFGSELNKENAVILHTAPDSQKPFLAYAADCIADLHFVGAAAGTTCIPLYRYDTDGNRQDNLTDWGLKQFRQHYGDSKITKRDIFHYTYAVLHHPAYRAKYEINLKREFPRLPFYEDFRQWAKWGKELMALHLDYEKAKPLPLERHDRKEAVSQQTDLMPDERIEPGRLLDEKPKLKPKLKADKVNGVIEVDAITTLSGIPPEAWTYQLGNRSALEWVLDQWKEHKISDPTVAEKFNTYRFADHKEKVIDLLLRVCTVSAKTMKIIRAFPN